MSIPLRLLRIVARAALNAVGGGFAGDLVIDVLPDIAREVWPWWAGGGDRVEEVQLLAAASTDQIKVAVAEVVGEVGAGESPASREALAAWISLVPYSLRGTFRRPTDPSGKSVPAGFVPAGPDDLITWLPPRLPRLPRFRPGDCPPGVGDWELIELLGVGGFGEVWKARHRHLDGEPPVALKFCLDRAAGMVLKNETKALNHVMRGGSHPGIVGLKHTYLSADPPCLEYEYVAGGDLAGLVADSRPRGGMTPGEAAGVVREIAAAVGFAHRLSPPLVHRDLKPANVLVQPSAGGKLTYRVADFGIGGVAVAHAVTESRRGTSRGQLLATSLRGSYTPLYASPQQMRGGLPDPRDDVYSLGVVWYQLLIGDLSASAPHAENWKKRLREKGMTNEHLDLLVSCFEDDPGHRPADAAELANRITGRVKPPKPPIFDEGTLHAYGSKWQSGQEPIAEMAKQLGCSWNYLHSQFTKLGYHGPEKKKTDKPEDVDVSGQEPEPRFLADMEVRRGQDEANVARAIIAWAKERGLIASWGKGKQRPGFSPVVPHKEARHILGYLWPHASFDIAFTLLKNADPFRDEAKRKELAGRLNRIPGVLIPDDRLDKSPPVPLAALTAGESLRLFLETLDLMVADIRAT